MQIKTKPFYKIIIKLLKIISTSLLVEENITYINIILFLTTFSFLFFCFFRYKFSPLNFSLIFIIRFIFIEFNEIVNNILLCVLIPCTHDDLNGIGIIPVVPLIVVNDGSSEPCRPVFDAVKRYSRVTLLEHEVNRGKGAAMKTAFAYIASNYSADESVMTVDADGQHLAKDALRGAERLNEHPDALILGSRKFPGNVPFKSRMGNAITRGVFRFTTGVHVYDTQSISPSTSRILSRICAARS